MYRKQLRHGFLGKEGEGGESRVREGERKEEGGCGERGETLDISVIKSAFIKRCY